jgi:hypothetical protein
MIPILGVAYLSARFVESPFLVARPIGTLRTVLGLVDTANTEHSAARASVDARETAFQDPA